METAASPSNTPAKAGYKSWKKKYRKMRINFEDKMDEADRLHQQEGKTQALIKRLALENDQLLDILLEINSSPQIPPEKRIDLALRNNDDANSAASLPLDREVDIRKGLASKRLEDLLQTPHSSYAATKEVPSASTLISDLKAPDGESYPHTFLSPDDVDNAFYQYDLELSQHDEEPSLLPTLAPKAHSDHHALYSVNIRNPVSVTNWLRKNAPKIFLQDSADHQDDDEGHTKKSRVKGGSAKEKPEKPEKGEKGTEKAEKEHHNKKSDDKPSSKASKPTPSSAKRKRVSKVRSGDDTNAGEGTPVKENEIKKSRGWDEDVDDYDESFNRVATIAKGKRKRDDDPGYRPKGGSSRPKKKRKSDGERKSKGEREEGGED